MQNPQDLWGACESCAANDLRHGRLLFEAVTAAHLRAEVVAHIDVFKDSQQFSTGQLALFDQVEFFLDRLRQWLREGAFHQGDLALHIGARGLGVEEAQLLHHVALRHAQLDRVFLL